jgi:hypothetical protein
MISVLRFGCWIVVFVCAARMAGAADPIVVAVWPDNPPGDIGIPGEEKSRTHDSRIVGPTRLVTNVTSSRFTRRLLKRTQARR